MRTPAISEAYLSVISATVKTTFVFSVAYHRLRSIQILFRFIRVRDRAIYRPTYILFDDGNPAQTSKDVRKEINSLPKSSFIYNTIMQFFKAALMDKNDEVVEDFLHILTHVGMQQVNCRSKIVKRYSYDWQTIESMGGSEKGQSAPNFICQMIELFEQDDTVRFYKKYWEPILSYKE